MPGPATEPVPLPGDPQGRRPGPDGLWIKLSDPDEPLPVVTTPGPQVRVLLPDDDRFTVVAEKLTGLGAQVRRVRYLLEDEEITSSVDSRQRRWLVAASRTCRLIRSFRGQPSRVRDADALAAHDAFDIMWQDHDEAVRREGGAVPAADLVPAELVRFLPFTDLNPAQTQALPEVFGHDGNLVVVAPTGAGKTVIGMAAALRAVVQQGRKAAWLVPQRSLTDELDWELAHWRRQGLRVERLSGEHTVDIDRIRGADLWVATTEKFEAICRASAFRDALAEVGSLIVDELHLLGDPARGAVLETLLARVRDGGLPTRLIGLSATISNAEQIAEWLRARLLRVAWRPTRLAWQLPSVPGYADFAVGEAARTRLAAAITGQVTRDGGSVLVFCGSKRNVRRTALVIAAGRGVDVSGVRPDDLPRLHEVCRRAGVGLHYQGWEHRRETELAFRRRELDVLVATSTVAAGVNLPARAVVIQDTQVGLNDIDVATVQQMFGRAGRLGAGEHEGWAFLIVDERERAGWQSRLVAGHTVLSQLRESLPEHVLGEAVQRRITSGADAERWWVQTLAHHQGQRSVQALHRSVEYLTEAGMLTYPGHGTAPSDPSPDLARAPNHSPDSTGTVHEHPGTVHEHPGAVHKRPGAVHEHPGTAHEHPGTAHEHPGTTCEPSTDPGAHRFVPTELGRLTARLMVSPPVCADLRRALNATGLPDGPHAAEEALIRALATLVPKLAQASVGEQGRAAVARLLATGGRIGGAGTDGRTRTGAAATDPPGATGARAGAGHPAAGGLRPDLTSGTPERGGPRAAGPGQETIEGPETSESREIGRDRQSSRDREAGRTQAAGRDPAPEPGGGQRGDLARAALLAAANSPDAFRAGVQQVGGVPYAAMYPVLEDAPRYLHWLACQGFLGTVHPWCAIVAADLERRVAWRRLRPPRGAGRLLWACEQMATAAYADEAVPRLWAAARAGGFADPDWTSAGVPQECRLTREDYHALLAQRATGARLEIRGDRVHAIGPQPAVLVVWRGPEYRVVPLRRGRAVADFPCDAVRSPAALPSAHAHAPAGTPARAPAPAVPRVIGCPDLGAALFTWRGDYLGTDWLSTYASAAGRRVDGGGADARGADRGGTDGRGTDRHGANGGGADARGTDRGGTDGRGTDGGGTDGGGTDGRGTDLRGTDDGGADGGGRDDVAKGAGVPASTRASTTPNATRSRPG